MIFFYRYYDHFQRIGSLPPLSTLHYTFYYFFSKTNSPLRLRGKPTLLTATAFRDRLQRYQEGISQRCHPCGGWYEVLCCSTLFLVRYGLPVSMSCEDGTGFMFYNPSKCTLDSTQYNLRRFLDPFFKNRVLRTGTKKVCVIETRTVPGLQVTLQG